MKTKIVLLALFLICQAALAAGPSVVGTQNVPTTVSTPCTVDSAFNSTSYLRKCSEVEGFLKTQLDAEMKLVGKQMYTEGKSKDSTYGLDLKSIGLDEDTSKNQDYRFAKPACNLVSGLMNMNVVEADTNHNQESCGAPASLKVDTYLGGATTYWDFTGSNGVREAAYYGGAVIQSFNCFVAQVENEVVQTKQLKISPSCQAAAVAVRDQGSQTASMAASLGRGLASQQNLKDLQNLDLSDCEQQNWDQSGQLVGFDQGKARNNRSQLCASRHAQEAMFAQLMRCEASARAGVDFRSVFSQPSTFLGMIQGSNGPAGQCAQTCANQCVRGSCITFGGFPPRPRFHKGSCDSCTTSCANSCYTPALENFVKGLLQRWDPSNPGSVCNKVSLFRALGARYAGRLA